LRSPSPLPPFLSLNPSPLPRLSIGDGDAESAENPVERSSVNQCQNQRQHQHGVVEREVNPVERPSVSQRQSQRQRLHQHGVVEREVSPVERPSVNQCQSQRQHQHGVVEREVNLVAKLRQMLPISSSALSKSTSFRLGPSILLELYFLSQILQFKHRSIRISFATFYFISNSSIPS
jgi:hypothetical protein